MRRFRRNLPASGFLAPVASAVTPHASVVLSPHSRLLSPQLNGSSAMPTELCTSVPFSPDKPGIGKKGLTASQAGMRRLPRVRANGRQHTPDKFRSVALLPEGGDGVLPAGTGVVAWASCP